MGFKLGDIVKYYKDDKEYCGVIIDKNTDDYIIYMPEENKGNKIEKVFNDDLEFVGRSYDFINLCNSLAKKINMLLKKEKK